MIRERKRNREDAKGNEGGKVKVWVVVSLGQLKDDFYEAVGYDNN